MQKNSIHILVLGSGFGGIYTIQSLCQNLNHAKNVSLSLIDKRNYFLFTPLLHEVATGGISYTNTVVPIRNLVNKHGVNFCLTTVQHIDLDTRIVATETEKLSYDFLVLALGSTTNFHGTPGAANAFTIKSLEDAFLLKNHIINCFEGSCFIMDKNLLRNRLHFVIVGGGPTGVELAGELIEFLHDTLCKLFPKELRAFVRVTLIHRGTHVLPQFAPILQKKALEKLREKGIVVRLETSVKQIEKGKLELADGTHIFTDTVIWVAGVSPRDVAIKGIVEKDRSGRLKTETTLQLKHYTNVFAVGDMACFTNPDGTIVPALAQAATQQAKHAAKNILRLLEGKRAVPFVYHHKGDLLSIGRWYAIGYIWHQNVHGKFVWWLWRTVYVTYIPSLVKKLRVVFDWTMEILAHRDITEFANIPDKK